MKHPRVPWTYCISLSYEINRQGARYQKIKQLPVMATENSDQGYPLMRCNGNYLLPELIKFAAPWSSFGTHYIFPPHCNRKHIQRMPQGIKRDRCWIYSNLESRSGKCRSRWWEKILKEKNRYDAFLVKDPKKIGRYDLCYGHGTPMPSVVTGTSCVPLQTSIITPFVRKVTEKRSE